MWEISRQTHSVGRVQVFQFTTRSFLSYYGQLITVKFLNLRIKKRSNNAVCYKCELVFVSGKSATRTAAATIPAGIGCGAYSQFLKRHLQGTRSKKMAIFVCSLVGINCLWSKNYAREANSRSGSQTTFWSRELLKYTTLLFIRSQLSPSDTLPTQFLKSIWFLNETSVVINIQRLDFPCESTAKDKVVLLSRPE